MILSSYGTDSRPMSETLSHHTSEAKRATAEPSGDSLLSPELDRREFIQLGGVVILPYLARGVKMEGNGNALPSPTPGSTEEPPKKPTNEPSPEPTKNPEVYLFVPGTLPVSVGAEDPWSRTRRIQETEELGNPFELQLHATLEGHTGWVLDRSDEEKPVQVAYRFAVLPYDRVSGDEGGDGDKNESEEPTYTIVEVRADRLAGLPEETLSQLPTPEEFPYEGPREAAEYVHIEDAVVSNDALSGNSSSGMRVMRDASPVKFAEGRRTTHTELPERSRRDALGTLALAFSRLLVGNDKDSEAPTQEDPKNTAKLKPATGLPHVKFAAIAVPGNQHELPIDGPYEQVTDMSGPADGGRGEGVRFWADGADTGQGFGVLYMDGRIIPYYNIGGRNEAFQIDTSNIDPETLQVTQRLTPDRDSVEIEYTDSSGEVITSTMELPYPIPEGYPMATITYVSEGDLDTTTINKSAVRIPADPRRLTDIITGAETPAARQAQRKDRMTSRPDGVLKVDGVTTTDGWHLDWYNKHIADLEDLYPELGNNPTIVFHRGALYEKTEGSNPDDRGSEFAMLINPETDGLPIMRDPQILAWLKSRGADARFVIDWRQLPEKRDRLASPVPRDVTKPQVLEALTQASKHKTPDMPIRTVLHGGIIGLDGQLDDVTGKINNISTVADELAGTLPEDPRVKFDHIPMLSRDTNLGEDGRFNMIHVLTTLNAHERIAMDTVMVSLAPTSGVDDATHLENLRKLAEDCQKIGVELEYMDLGASSITRAQVADLQRISARGESKVYLAETLNPDRNNPNAEPLFTADNRGRLTRTSAYDKAVKSMG